MLNQRAAKLLNVILNNRNITIGQLETKLHYTRRQVDYALGKINDWLETNNLPVIENIRDEGLKLEENVRDKIHELLSDVNIIDYIPSPDDRMKLIFIKLFIKNDYLSVNHFTDMIKMSRNTVLSHIQMLKEQLTEENIDVLYNRKDGYQLHGDEINIRSIAFKYISYLLQLPNGKQLLEEIYESQEKKETFHDTYTEIYSIMNKIEADLDVSFVDEQLIDLTVFYLFLIFRMQNRNESLLSDEFINTIESSDAYLVAQKLTEVLPFEVDKSENVYIAMHLLGLNTSYLERMLDKSDDNELSKIIDNVIVNFEKLACITFTNSEEAKRALFLHLKPAYYRSLFKIPITNPYLEKIKQEYFDLFILVRKSLVNFEKALQISIPEDEIGFVTLHFGAFLKKHRLPYRRRKCIIICPNGVSTSYMLKRQMEQLLPEVEVVKVMSPREYKQYNHEEIDFIISTVSIKAENPVIIVSPILTDAEKSKLIQEVNLLFYRKRIYIPKSNELMKAIRQHATVHNEEALYQVVNEILTGASVKDLGRVKPVLNQLLTRETIQLTEKADNWKEAIQQAANPLLNNNTIEEKYISAMIKSVEKIGPYIVLAPKVAIPHARPEDGVNKVGMSLLKLTKPVSFSENDPEKDVNLIFVIAAIDNEMHLKALSQLTELLEDEAVVNEMVNTTDKESLISFINKYS